MDEKMKEQIAAGVAGVFEELAQAAGLKAGQIMVLGASSSEVLGLHIGKATSAEVGQAVIAAALAVTRERGLFLAVQCCEHLNRALVVEEACAQAYGLEIVSARPVPEAGGACAAAAYEAFSVPVLVEHIEAHAGVDIGDTSIGMHVKFVQVPFRPTVKRIGEAHVTALRSRGKLIGGERAKY